MIGLFGPLGGVAQLGERGVRNAEVTGSNPVTSTNTLSPHNHAVLSAADPSNDEL
jgi:hypothetical protein